MDNDNQQTQPPLPPSYHSVVEAPGKSGDSKPQSYPENRSLGTEAEMSNLGVRKSFSPFDKLTTILDTAPEILFVIPKGGVSICGSPGEIVQMKDGQGRPLMATAFTPGGPRARENEGCVPSTSVTKFNDSEGRLLATAAEQFRTFTVTSGEQTVGVIHGCGLFTANVTAKDSNGHRCFHSVVRSGVKTFIAADGTVIGTLKKNDKESGAILNIDPHVEPRVKLLLLVAAFNLFLFHFAKTCCGFGGGLRRARLIWCLSMFSCILLIVVLIGLLPLFT